MWTVEEQATALIDKADKADLVANK